MRRVLTTLMILLVVLVAGLSALVIMVNPNDFRAYMVRQVEARSGYQLQLDGPLRWHVWPQLSILSGRITLTAPGAAQPVVKADNMRLDVGLLPLLSHQLQVKQVMLKGAVIQLTPQTRAAQQDAPVVPKENTLPQVAEDRGWSWDIARLQVADSVLVVQHEDDEQVTVRDIRLQMEQDAQHQASVEFAGRVNRDQRDLTLSLKAKVDASDYPRHLNASISDLKWQLQGGDVPPQGINGQGSLAGQWQGDSQRITLDALQLTANDSAFSGKGSVTLAGKPQWALDLQFDTLNLDNLLIAKDNPATQSTSAQQGQKLPPRLPRPVIASSTVPPEYTSLRDFSAKVSLTAKRIQWRGMQFADVNGQFTNAAGLLTIPTLEGKLGEGTIALPGTLDVRTDRSQAQFQPRLDNVEIGTILTAFDYPISLTGKMSMAGDFSGNRVDADDFRHNWQGDAHVEIKDSRMEGLNFQQLIQQAVARSSDVEVQQNYDNATRLDSFRTELSLDDGVMTMQDMQGASPLLTLSGEGELDLIKEQCDTRFTVRVLEGWKGDGKLVEYLKNTAIPLTVYGQWQSLNYSLQVDQILRKHLQDEAKRKLNEWADRNKDSQNGKDLKKLLNKL